MKAGTLVAIGVTSALLGALVAATHPFWLVLQKSDRQDSRVESLAWLLPEPPPQPPPPAEIAVFQPDQVQQLSRNDGSTMSVGYSSVILDPRWVDLEFFGGWNREFEANRDAEALLFFTGPTFEKGHPNEPLGMVLHGDLMLSDGIRRAGNRAAASERAYIAVTEAGELRYGFGDLTRDRQERYRLFIGGLHAFAHRDSAPPSTYRGVYGPMRLADVRIVYGFRPDGRLEVIETDDGVLFDDLHRFVQARGFTAAFLPDHASKSRLIVPGRRVWSEEQAVWVSGGKPSITALPFMMRVLPRTLSSASARTPTS
jgi:hypothetical protein